jgi:hypothetical protein
MSKNKQNLADRLEEIVELQRGGLSNREIGLILADRDKREENYAEASIRHAVARALSKRATELGLGKQ